MEDKKIWKGIAKIIDHSDEYLTYDAVFKLYYFAKDTSEIENFDNKVKNLQSALSKLGYNKNNAEIPDRLFRNITLNLEAKPSQNYIKIFYYTNKTQETPLFIREEKAQKLVILFFA